MAAVGTREPVRPSSSQPPAPQPSRSSRAIAWAKRHFLSFTISSALLWVVGIPILFVLVFSFLDGNPVLPGNFTLDNYRQAYGNPRTYSALGNTVIYATVVTLISLSMATLFAWLIERTDMPGRNWAWVMMLLPIAMPGMLASMAWILLLSPKVGLVNMMLRGVLGLVGIHLETGPLNVF